MVENQTRVTGPIEIAGLGLGFKVEKLIGKAVTVFTIDGNAVTGEVIDANFMAVYIAESPERTRMIKSIAITSISMSKEDAEQLRAKEKVEFSSPKVIPKPISVPRELPRV